MVAVSPRLAGGLGGAFLARIWLLFERYSMQKPLKTSQKALL